MPVSKVLPPLFTGVITVVCMTVGLLFWFTLFFLPFLLLRLFPGHRLQRYASDRCVAVATRWVGTNQTIYRLMHGQQGHVHIEGELQAGRSYLVISNHRAWSDILILFDTLHGKAPFGRFFLKKELIWVPIIGVVCWAMDFPFMKRHSRKAIARNPELANQDLETTRKACEKYKASPVTVINFLEGTRFNPEKHARSKSPYALLLPPKYAGLSATLDAMGEQFAGILDVTIAYEPVQGNLTWSWLCGRQRNMQVHIRIIPVEPSILGGDYRNDTQYKARFKAWVNSIWVQKDQALARMRKGTGHQEGHIGK